MMAFISLDTLKLSNAFSKLSTTSKKAFANFSIDSSFICSLSFIALIL
jgi:hypothetical protein